jgi:hypothetical protein
MHALDAASLSLLESLNILQIKLSAHKNQSLCNVASFFGIFAEAEADKVGKLPQQKSMAGDEAGRSFWGPGGIIRKSESL